MASLTPQQIAQYAYNAGFRGDALNQAVAIALAESGGNPQAYNPETAAGTKTGSGSRGLWQIYGTAHPEYNNSKTFDPQVNANAAFKVFKEAGNRFTPWSTWNNGVRANQNYAAMIKGKSPVSTVIRGNVAPVLNSKPKTTTTTTTTTTTQPVAALTNSLNSVSTSLNSISGVADSVKGFFGLDYFKKSGDAIAYDVIFAFMGGTLVLIGIIALLAIGTGKFASDNKELIAEVAKLAI